MTHRMPDEPDRRRTGTPAETTSIPVERLAEHPWLILAVIGLAQLMVVLDTTIVNIALPSAQRELGFTDDNRQWIITAYALAFGSLLLLGGRLSDVLGRRRVLVIGLLGFAVASAIGGAATGFEILVASRAAQGVFGALLAPAALSTLNVTFTEPRARGRAYAVYSAIVAGGAVLGLLLGGALTEWSSWRWTLFVNLAFAIPAALGAAVYVVSGDARRRRDGHLDLPGAVTVGGGLSCLVLALARAETNGWGAPSTLLLFGGAAVLLVAFLVVENAVKTPLLPMRILVDRNRAGAYVAVTLCSCSLFGVFLFLTYFFQRNLHFSPIQCGLAFLPFSAGIAAASGISNTVLVPRVGPRPTIPLGMLIAAGGMYWLAQLEIDTTYPTVVIPLIVLGVGMGLSFAPAIITATAGIAPADAGVASAMVNTSQQIGGAMGTAALSSVFATAVSDFASKYQGGQSLPGAAVHGYSAAFSVACAALLAGAAGTALLLRSGRLPPSVDGSPAVG